MIRRERMIFWVLLFGAFLSLLLVLSEVLLPFVAGMAIAYFLDPVVDRLERMGWSRTLGTTLVLLGFLLVVVGFVLLLLPVLNVQAQRLAEVIPGLLTRFEPYLGSILSQLDPDVTGEPFDNIPVMAGEALKWIVGFMGRIVSGGVAIANLLSLILITPIVAFYLLRDWDQLVAKIDGWLPQEQRETIREQSRAIDRSLAAFVRGQGSVCIVLAVFYAISLSAAGLQFGVVIGIFVGLISFIPFVGAILGGVLSVGLAVVQFPGWEPVAVVATIFVVGQILEGNVLTPKLVGDAVGLHPVWVIFALLAGGAMFGFVGVLLAMPVSAVVGVLSRFALKRYLSSPLHLKGTSSTDKKEEEDDDPPGGPCY